MSFRRRRQQIVWPRSGIEPTQSSTSPKLSHRMLARLCQLTCGVVVGSLPVPLAYARRWAPIGERQVRSPESISYETHAHCLLHGLDLGIAEDASCWNELLEILQGCSRSSREALEAELCEPGSASSETRRSRARLRFVAALAEWVNMHDLHKPYAFPPPRKGPALRECGRRALHERAGVV